MKRKRESAGLILFQFVGGKLHVLLAHPGGPWNARKDDGHWSIPKGEFEETEDRLCCARREFTEEAGQDVPEDAEMISLAPIRQKGGKIVHAWAFEGVWKPEQFRSNRFEMEWPPGSGKLASFPEVDRAELFPLQQALVKVKESQQPLLEQLQRILDQRQRAAGGGPNAA